MLDIKPLIGNIDGAADRLRSRDPNFDLQKFIDLDNKRRRVIQDVEQKKAEQNRANKEIGARKLSGESAADILEKMKILSAEIKDLDDIQKAIGKELDTAIEVLPNIPLPETPVGRDKSANVVAHEYGKPLVPADWDFGFRNHLEVAETIGSFGGLDFARSAKMTGSNWPLYRGDLARLEWALVSFLIDRAVADGRELIIPPYLVNSHSMYSSGQFPKFRDQAYECKDDDLVLIPTSEVPLLNLLRDEILDDKLLPLRLASFTPCFRREAGTYGAGERGLVRVHQFHKVEIFSYTRPDESMDELDRMVKHAEGLVEALELPYRTSILATGDLAQQAAYTVDVEVWLPGQNAFSEVSSVSNCTDYQARRANIRYRPEIKKKPEFVHTLNGSALATSRIMVSILEHYQLPDGGITIPLALRDYLNDLESIRPN